MPMLDGETYDKSLLPSGLKRDVTELITVAVALGWKVHVATTGGVTIIAPDERKKYHFGRHRASTSLNRIRRDLFKFGDPELVAMADSALSGKTPKDVALLLPHIGDKGTVTVEEQEPKKVANKAGDSHCEQPAEKDDYVPADTHIVSERPMLAKAREGSGYRSATITERKWSDGATDYKCMKCDFTSPNRLSVRGHFSSHRTGQGAVPPTFPASVPDAATYKPRQSRIDALAEVIRAMMAEGVTEPGDLARESLMWVHEQSSKGTAHAAEHEEMSEGDILARIRALLDDGTQVEALREKDAEMAALQERMDAAEHRAMEVEEKLREAETKARKAESTLNTFIELATELRVEEAQGA